MENASRAARWFIGFVTLCGAVALASAVLQTHAIQSLHFLILLVIALAGSRLKVKLPGVTGNMSVNLPFILIATLQLSPLEAMAIALSSTAAQCFPEKRGRPNGLQLLFNLSTMAIAVRMAEFVAHHKMLLFAGEASQALALVTAGATFLVLQTGPVATIVALTEDGTVLRIWSTILRLSFPYYVLSAGVTSLTSTAGELWGWQTPLLLMLTMYWVHRSYRTYFGRFATTAPVTAMAKAAAQ